MVFWAALSSSLLCRSWGRNHMSLFHGGKTIERVAIIDDDPAGRRVLEFLVQDAELDFVSYPGPLPPLVEFVKLVVRDATAALCDHRLAIRGAYAPFFGADTVSSLYLLGVPAVLCTWLSTTVMIAMRKLHRNIHHVL